MKKIFTSMLALAAMLMPNAANAGSVVIEPDSKSDANLLSEFTKVRQADQRDTIYISWKEGGMSMKAGTKIPTSGTIVLIGISNPDTKEQAMLRTELLIQKSEEADHLCLFFENLILEDINGAGGNSKHFINAKDTDPHCFDSLVIRNCEIRNICRTFYRIEPQKGEVLEDGTQLYTDAGTMKYFEMSNCRFHYASTQTNAMPLFYMGQKTETMVFRNNTFYDLPYLNNIVTFNYMDDYVSRATLNFTFENNTVVAVPKTSLFSFGSYVMPDSEYNINNNLFLYPYWSDEFNNIGLDEEGIAALKGQPYASIQYGMVYCKNNVLQGFKTAKEDINEDGEGAWYDSSINDLTMEDVQLAWTDFADAENKNFKIWKGHKLFTSGLDGAPIGNINEYSETKIVTVSVTATVEGSKTASVDISPKKDIYESGETITLTANTNGLLNEFKGWSNGETEKTITVVLPEEDFSITATFEELPYIAAWNMSQLEKNNVKLDAPLAPNYGDENVLLKYATWDGTQYVDSLTEAFMTRNNKVQGDVRNCFFIHTSEETFALKEEGHADYVYVDIPTVEESYLQFCVATDNVPYKKYAVSYKTDADWTDITTFEMTETGKWNIVKAELPAELVGKAAQVRIKGIEAEGQFISADFLEDPEFTPITEFLFVTEFYLVKSNAAGINDLTATKTLNADAPVYNMMGMRVNKNTKGLLIQNGRKFIVK